MKKATVLKILFIYPVFILLSGCSFQIEKLLKIDSNPASDMQKNVATTTQESQIMDTPSTLPDMEKEKSESIPTASTTKFDSCGKKEKYSGESWYSSFIEKTQSYLGENNLSEMCLSLDKRLLIAITDSYYCEPGSLFKYDVKNNVIAKATLKDHERGCIGWPQEFGKREGTVIDLQSRGGDAGCEVKMYFDYNFIENIIELKKECGICEGDKEEACYLHYDKKEYSNEQYGLSFEYPENWTLTANSGVNYDPSIVSLTSPETAANFKKRGTPYKYDISFYYYPSVAEEPENKANKYDAKDLSELIEKNQLIKEVGKLDINGAPATEVIWGGHSLYYTILIEHDFHLYKIMFNNLWEKEKLSDVEKQIIESIKLQ